MKGQTPSVESLVREAFDLLLAVRRKPKAARLLSLAIVFLKAVLRDSDLEQFPVVISVQTLGARKR